MNEALNAAAALMERAKRVCEACFLGIATEGVTPSVNPNVQGVGIGNKVVHRIPTKEKVLQVYVGRKIYGSLVPKDQRIPDEIEGIPTDVVETGIFRIGKKFPPIYQRRVRPAPAGVSVGHKDISAGTFGALVREGSDTYILSNNHVLANENLGKVGDNVLQPGPYDGGRPDRDTIAQLAGFVPLKADEANLVDAAIATPIVREEVAPEILNIGRAKGDAERDVRGGDVPLRVPRRVLERVARLHGPVPGLGDAREVQRWRRQRFADRGQGQWRRWAPVRRKPVHDRREPLDQRCEGAPGETYLIAASLSGPVRVRPADAMRENCAPWTRAIVLNGRKPVHMTERASIWTNFRPLPRRRESTWFWDPQRGFASQDSSWNSRTKNSRGGRWPAFWA